ncbi:MAG: hypothetical protein NTY10_02210 [Candidatus Omnitrophica bacterium]|nr:hypothetical protein [Candidatus Omnitrophota bacterium]
MTSRELISDTLARRPTSRIPICDLAFWPETIERWKKEGLPESADIHEYFGLDRIFTYGPDNSPGFKEKTLEENETFAIYTDNFGNTLQRWKTKTAPPANIRYGATNMEEALNCLKRYNDIAVDRVDVAQIEEYKKAQKRGDFITVTPLEPAWFVIEHLLGFEKGLTAFMEYPDEVSRIMEQLADFSIAHLKWLIESKGIQFDGLWFFADLCYRNGMLFSPSVYRRIVQPIHRKYRQFCDENNLFFMLHCDGDVRNFIPLLIETGFDAIQPLEARAGNDVRELKRLYGNKITFFGNINADVIARGAQKEIVEEVTSKVNAAKKGGGYIYHIDHSVPPTVSFDNYCLLLKTLKEVMYF